MVVQRAAAPDVSAGNLRALPLNDLDGVSDVDGIHVGGPVGGSAFGGTADGPQHPLPSDLIARAVSVYSCADGFCCGIPKPHARNDQRRC